MEVETQAMDERRSYAVIRDDLPLTCTSYLALSALGYSQLSMLCIEQPQLMDGYDRNMQPKLVLRAKNANAFAKAEQALRAAGTSFVIVEHAGEAAGIFLPPLPRSALPKEVSSLQLFSECRHPATEDETPVVAGEGDITCPVVFRTSLEAPLGKMMAQVGHAAWSAVAKTQGNVRMLVLGVDEQAMEQAQSNGGWHNIVDAGRTVFGKPTLTCVWGGYIPEPEETITLETNIVLNTPSEELKP